jgi:hypothetical protein
MTEQELVAKYKNAGIVKGSLKRGARHHKGKNVVKCKCWACSHVSVVATSDLWIKHCANAKCREKLNRKKGSK